MKEGSKSLNYLVIAIILVVVVAGISLLMSRFMGNITNFAIHEIEDGDVDDDLLSLNIVYNEINIPVELRGGISQERIEVVVLNTTRISEDEIKIDYSLSESSGHALDVSLEFIIYDSKDNQIVSISDQKKLSTGSGGEHSLIVPLDSSFGGNLNMLINIKSNTYVASISEDILLGKQSVTAWAIFGSEDSELSLMGILIIAFVIFAIVIMRKIFRRKNKIKQHGYV